METLVEGRAFLEGPRWHDGALWVSDMHAHEVLRVGAGGDVTVVASLDGPPSGLGWLPDGRMLIVSMHDRRVLRLEPDGTLAEAADCTAQAPNEINGICIDAEDAVWIASPVSDRFVRICEGGEVLDTVECPGRHAIACALGGDDGRTLYCCTSTTVGEPALSAKTRGSRLETARVEVPAAG